MIRDILVVLTVIVVIGLALLNRPARSETINAEHAVIRQVVIPAKGRAILPPIKYDKPYDNISILEVKDVYQIKEWCNLTSFLAIACAKKLGETCVIIKVSDQDSIRWGYKPEYVMRHEHGHCWPNGWSNKHEGARVPTPEDDARWRSLYKVSDLYKGVIGKGAGVP